MTGQSGPITTGQTEKVPMWWCRDCDTVLPQSELTRTDSGSVICADHEACGERVAEMNSLIREEQT